MGSILEALFYGNIRPDEGIHPKHSEYQELNREISSFINDYHKKLSPEDYDELETFIDLLGQSTSMYSAAAYKEGFRLGALMMIEVMGTEGKAVGDSRE